MDKLIACCGLDCRKCDAYIATMNNDDNLRKKTADLIINVLVANALKLFFVLAAILFVFNS